MICCMGENISEWDKIFKNYIFDNYIIWMDLEGIYAK